MGNEAIESTEEAVEDEAVVLNDGEDQPREVEEEDKTMSYEEYLKQKKEAPESELLAPIVPMKEFTNEFEGIKMSGGNEEEALFASSKGKQLRRKNKKEAEKITPAFRV